MDTYLLMSILRFAIIIAVIAAWRLVVLRLRRWVAERRKDRNIRPAPPSQRRRFDNRGEVVRQVDDLLAWLPGNSDPELWHLLVANLNYDYQATWDIVLWIVQQPNCDRATAVNALDLISPDVYCGYASAEDVPEIHHPIGWRICQVICERSLAGSYTSEQFNLTGVGRENDIGSWLLPMLEKEEATLISEGRRLPWPLPVTLLDRPCLGRDAVSDEYVVNDDTLYKRLKPS